QACLGRLLEAGVVEEEAGLERAVLGTEEVGAYGLTGVATDVEALLRIRGEGARVQVAVRRQRGEYGACAVAELHLQGVERSDGDGAIVRARGQARRVDRDSGARRRGPGGGAQGEPGGVAARGPGKRASAGVRDGECLAGRVDAAGGAAEAHARGSGADDSAG